MSAYMVDEDHINYLLTAGMNLYGKQVDGGAMTWYVPEAPDAEDEHERGQPWGAGYEKRIAARRRVLTAETADTVGRMLIAQNRVSIDHRYDEEEIEDLFFFRKHTAKIVPVQVIKAISCYEYQACEGPEWAGSEAKVFCNTLKDYAVDALPGYDKAKWGAPARKKSATVPA